MRNRFWLLRPPDSPPKADWDAGKVKLETVTCPADPGIEWRGELVELGKRLGLLGKRCPAHQRAGKRLTNLSVVLLDGPLEDFVRTSSSEQLLQDHVLELFRRHEFSGFEVKPVAARFEKSPEPAPKLWELVLTGWAGVAKPESGIRLDESASCNACGMLRYTGLTNAEHLIDESKWDGSDFFMVWPLPMYVFVTERVVNMIDEYHLTGIRIEAVSELKQSPHVIPGYSPGRLSYSMPEKRARELGEPLGIY
jgi:hypothetical protein